MMDLTDIEGQDFQGINPFEMDERMARLYHEFAYSPLGEHFGEFLTKLKTMALYDIRETKDEVEVFRTQGKLMFIQMVEYLFEKSHRKVREGGEDGEEG